MRTELSKLIRKEIKHVHQEAQVTEIDQILAECKGFKKIPEVKRRGKRHLISHLQDNKGQLQNSWQEIIDIFTTFYKELYSTNIQSNAHAKYCAPGT